MPDVKAYAVGDATALTGLAESDDLMELLPNGEYNLTLDATTTVTVPALTAGSIAQASPNIGDTLTVSGSNAPSSGVAYQWQESADGSTGWSNISGATSASLNTSSGVTDDYYVRRGIEITGVQSMVYTAAVQVDAAAAGITGFDEIGAVVWLDMITDWTYQKQDEAGTTDVTAAGQPVNLLVDRSGNGNDFKPQSSNGVSGTGALAWNNALFFTDTSLVGLTDDMELLCLINTIDTLFCLAGKREGGGGAAGQAESGSSNTTITTVDFPGTLSYSKNGNVITPANRGELSTEWATGSYVIAGMAGFDFSTGFTTTLMVLSYRTAGVSLDGDVKTAVLLDRNRASYTSERASAIALLKSQGGIA